MFPGKRVDGTNKAGATLWKHSTGTSSELWSAAAHYNITVHCDSKGTPMLPNIAETVGFEHPDYSTMFDHTYDVVISRHALNAGKLRPNASCIIIPQV